MALTNAWVQVPTKIPEVFNKIRDGQAPERFTQQLLKDWGFGTKNDRAFIPLLKAIGFLTADSKPTQRYTDYRDHSRSRQVMGQGFRDAYGDLFLIKERPTEADKNAIQGKFKSFHNTSDNVAGHMTKTFLGLLKLADVSPSPQNQIVEPPSETIENGSSSNGRWPSEGSRLVCITMCKFICQRLRMLRFTMPFSNHYDPISLKGKDLRDFLFRGLMFESEAERFRRAGIQIGASSTGVEESLLKEALAPFSIARRNSALEMARLFAVLYCFENEIRDFIRDILQEEEGNNWLEKLPPITASFPVFH